MGNHAGKRELSAEKVNKVRSEPVLSLNIILPIWTVAAGFPAKTVGVLPPALEASGVVLGAQTEAHAPQPGPQPMTVLLSWPFWWHRPPVPVHSVAVPPLEGTDKQKGKMHIKTVRMLPGHQKSSSLCFPQGVHLILQASVPLSDGGSLHCPRPPWRVLE